MTENPIKTPIEWKLCKFSEMNVYELHDVMKLRSEIFVVEQNCVYLDIDGSDPTSLHLLGYIDREGSASKLLIAYCRIFDPETEHIHSRSNPESNIGRVIVHVDYRKYGYGKELMEKAIDILVHDYPKAPIRIAGQMYLKKFYNDLGFDQDGDPFDEDGIEHVDMLYTKHI